MYNKINKLLRVIDVGAWVIALVYFAYVLCSPGLYLQFVLYLLILLVCTYLLVKVRSNNKEKISKYTEDELRRCRYKSTYRKRYHNVVYLFLLIVIFVFSTTYLAITIFKQSDKAVNTRFITSINQVADEIPGVDVVSKVSILIPNSVKELMTSVCEIIVRIESLAESLNGNVDEDMVEKEVAELQEYAENEIEKFNGIESSIRVYIMLFFASLLLFKYSLSELQRYMRHRSFYIEDEDYIL